MFEMTKITMVAHILERKEAFNKGNNLVKTDMKAAAVPDYAD